MPLRTLARLPAAAGERVSRLLHTFVFSLPTPTNTSVETNTTLPSQADTTAASEAMKGIGIVAGVMPDPGATRALAAGVGPISFVGSGYGMILVLMAILLNRIHHIVQRPRPPPPTLMPLLPVTLYGAFRLQLARWLTSSVMPSLLRLPGLFGLVRAWVLFSVVTLQTAEVWPLDLAERAGAITAGWPSYAGIVAGLVRIVAASIDRVGTWVGEMEMEDVCWNVFLCVCSGLVFGALANGLDRARRRDVGAGFNLFGYSFLLHLYSSPLTHHSPPPATNHGRPDVHALLHLWVGLTELTWLQAIELSTTLRRNQLLPTGVCGALGLIHFVYALLTAPLRFPSFTFVTHLLALLLSLVVISTIVLRAITHLLTVGYIPSPVWSNLLPHEGAIPSIEDDAGVALLKLGTACIEATSYSGLRNELAPVKLKQASLKLSAVGCDAVDVPLHANMGGLNTRIDDIQVTELTDPNADGRYMRELGNFRRACVSLVSDVFWCGVLGTPTGRRLYRYIWKAYHARWWYGPRQWRFWRRAAWTAPRRAEPQPPALTIPSTGTSSAVKVRRVVDRERVTPLPVADETEYTYDQVLRGEVELADDDDEWESHASGSSTGSLSDDEEDAGQALYRDLVLRDSEGAEDPAALQPILLAHLTSEGTLTRRRYAAMLQRTPDDLSQLILARRAEVANAAVPRDEWDEERRSSCVVCMTQPRDVIVWPCRCLLMCNDCRESLAARLAAKDHACPNCRTKVEGYSRIYVP